MHSHHLISQDELIEPHKNLSSFFWDPHTHTNLRHAPRDATPCFQKEEMYAFHQRTQKLEIILKHMEIHMMTTYSVWKIVIL